MRVNKIDSYGYNILFSYVNSTSTLPIDLSEYKSIKKGAYKKALKSYYSTYNSDGVKNIQSSGILFDKYI